MRSNLTLGRLAGVRIEINWSVLIIAALITLSVSGSLLPAAVPGLSGFSYLAGGLIATAALLGSILLHVCGLSAVSLSSRARLKPPVPRPR